jgi:hypothetical protein
MTFFGMQVLTAVGTIVLAVFAIFTFAYAARAFREQSKEVSAIEQQVKDGHELAEQQAKLLKVQSDQLELQRKQADEQGEVLKLQARELRESIDQRKREAEEQRRSQAAKVSAWLDRDVDSKSLDWGAIIRNESDDAIFDIRTFFHLVAEKWTGGDWDPRDLGGPPKRIRVLPGGGRRFVDIPDNVQSQMTGEGLGGFGTTTKDLRNNYVVSIEFTDANGNRWQRDPHGGLNPLDPPPPAAPSA